MAVYEQKRHFAVTQVLIDRLGTTEDYDSVAKTLSVSDVKELAAGLEYCLVHEIASDEFLRLLSSTKRCIIGMEETKQFSPSILKGIATEGVGNTAVMDLIAISTSPNYFADLLTAIDNSPYWEKRTEQLFQLHTQPSKNEDRTDKSSFEDLFRMVLRNCLEHFTRQEMKRRRILDLLTGDILRQLDLHDQLLFWKVAAAEIRQQSLILARKAIDSKEKSTMETVKDFGILSGPQAILDVDRGLSKLEHDDPESATALELHDYTQLTVDEIANLLQEDKDEVAAMIAAGRVELAV